MTTRVSLEMFKIYTQEIDYIQNVYNREPNIDRKVGKLPQKVSRFKNKTISS